MTPNNLSLWFGEFHAPAGPRPACWSMVSVQITD
jgi:hypothetical protein